MRLIRRSLYRYVWLVYLFSIFSTIMIISFLQVRLHRPILTLLYTDKVQHELPEQIQHQVPCWDGLQLLLGLQSIDLFTSSTCFHEFSEYESKTFFTNISMLKKKTTFLLVNKRHFFSVLIIWENQNKHYIIFGKAASK